MRLHGRGLAVDDDDVVVLLEGECNLVPAVEGNELRLGIVAGDLGETGQRHMLDRRAIGRPVLQRQDHEIACRHLRDLPVIDVLVALVLDRDCGKRPILVHGHRVRLAAEIAGGVHLPPGNVDHGEHAGRLGKAFARVDGNERFGAGYRDRSRLPAERDDTACLRRLGIGDVDEPDALAGTVGIDQRIAVFACGDDFGRCRRVPLGSLGQIRGHRKGRDAIEYLFGLNDRCRRCGKRRGQCRGDGKCFHLSLLVATRLCASACVRKRRTGGFCNCPVTAG